MIHLRPQRVYKPNTSSGNPNNSIANYLDRYYNQGLYRLRLETPRGTSLTEDNSQITCYAHVFNNKDGSEVTDRLKGRGFRPTWLLDGKSIDSVCISEEGYLLTLDSAHLTDYTQTVTLQALDTEILSALSDELQFDLWLQQTLKGQGIQPTLLKQSETLINFALVNKKLKVGGRNLLLNSDKPLSNKEYYVGRYHISDPSLMVAGECYTIQIWAAIEGADFSESIWVYNSGGNTEVANIQKLDNGVWQETFKWRDDSDKSNRYLDLFRGANHPNNKNSYNTTIKRIKLERGTVATDWTPAPEDVEESVSKVSTDLTLLERSLLDNDTGEIQKLKKLLGNHGKHFEELAKALAGKASTGDVKKSARDAIAEAIKRAGEMDREIKVGGRNLFRNKYFIGDLASRYEIPFDALQPREGDNTYTLSLDYKISPEDKASLIRISCWYIKREFGGIVYDSDIKRDGEWHHKEYTIKLDIDPSKYPIYGWFTDYSSSNGRTIEMVAVRNVKLERGTVATDWTPAPEDVAESVSDVSTNLTLLERSLLDPEQGKIKKLEKLLGNHGNRFEELESHPLTVDEAGFWRIWSVKDGAYKTTQYKSRGEDAGRYLGRAKRIHPNFNGNYMLETETAWRTAKEGDYVYLVGDAPNRGGDKETYYVVREHTSKTEWEVYNIKGHTPRLTLDEKFHLLADGEMVSNISLKGEAGHSPSPEDVLDSQKFQELVTTPFYNDLSITNKYLENAFAHINNIFTTMASDRTYTITSSGYVSSRVAQTCPNISKDYAPKHVDCNIPRAEPQIRLVTYSAYESLKSQVEMLTSKLAQLEARTSVTPITNTDLRQDFDDAYSFRISLYPKYGDWLLTSDSKEQNISFAGLKAEVGRSIYIQTRKRAYLYANGHSFYGLPGSSTSENQWLSNNTTYRFVRASSTSWCVTSSSSPYPWT